MLRYMYILCDVLIGLIIPISNVHRFFVIKRFPILSSILLKSRGYNFAYLPYSSTPDLPTILLWRGTYGLPFLVALSVLLSLASLNFLCYLSFCRTKYFKSTVKRSHSICLSASGLFDLMISSLIRCCNWQDF